MRLPLIASLVLAAACGTDHVLCDFGPGCSQQGILQVSPTTLVDSASVAAGPQRIAVRVLNAGGGAMSWNALVLDGSSWLTLPVDSGRGGDSLVVRLDPAGLTVGDYRDSVVVLSESGGTLKLPVDLRVIP
jgi:hypothetical protein